MPNAVVMTGYGPPEVLKWAGVPLPEPGQGQIRIKVKAAGLGVTGTSPGEDGSDVLYVTDAVGGRSQTAQRTGIVRLAASAHGGH
jgi:hypothetical protein